MKEREVIELPAKTDLASEKAHRQLRVAAYCRVSTNLESQQNSYQVQKEYYTDKIARNPDWTLADIFADEGITGTSVNKRNEFQRMIRWCEQGKIDMILTKSISRFARNTVDCLSYVRELQKLGTPVIFETEGIDTSKMEGELQLTLLGANSQAESEATSSRVKWGVRASFRGGKVRYYYKSWLGYKKGENGEPEIIPEEAAVVRSIFSSYLNGCSLREISTMLEQEEIPSKSGAVHWPIATLSNILKNEKYAGDALLQKTYTTDPISKRQKKNNGVLPQYLVKNCHDAIISRDTFDLVQEEMRRRASVENTVKRDPSVQPKTYSRKYALSSILVCHECNSLYQRCVWKKRGKTRLVWRCRNRTNYGTRYCKNSPTLDEQMLHHALTEAINKQLYRPEYLHAPFHITPSAEDAVEVSAPAKSMPELYKNLIELQKSIDSRFIDLSIQCAEQKAWEQCTTQFQTLMDERRKYDAYIAAFKLQQYEEQRRQAVCDLPYRLAAYDDLVERLVLDTVRVISKDKLLVVFKGGADVEQTIE